MKQNVFDSIEVLIGHALEIVPSFDVVALTDFVDFEQLAVNTAHELGWQMIERHSLEARDGVTGAQPLGFTVFGETLTGLDPALSEIRNRQSLKLNVRSHRCLPFRAFAHFSGVNSAA